MNYHVGDIDKLPLSIHINGIVYAANDVRLLLVKAIIYDRFDPTIIMGRWSTSPSGEYQQLPSSSNQYYIPFSISAPQFEDKHLMLQITIEIADLTYGTTIKRTGELSLGIIKPIV
jgi:hypothetical protein